jgi:hypothetical protein
MHAEATSTALSMGTRQADGSILAQTIQISAGPAPGG